MDKLFHLTLHNGLSCLPHGWHVDVMWKRFSHSWWRHQKEKFSALLAIRAGNSPATGKFPAQRPVTGALTFSFICAWITGWVNSREAGDLRRHRAHDDVTVMCWPSVRGIPCKVGFPHKESVMRNFDVIFVNSLNKQLNRRCRFQFHGRISICILLRLSQEVKYFELWSHFSLLGDVTNISGRSEKHKYVNRQRVIVFKIDVSDEVREYKTDNVCHKIKMISFNEIPLKMSSETCEPFPLPWRHNGHDGVPNHQPYECLLNRLFKHRSKKTSKLRVTGLYEGNSLVIGEFPAQRASNTENVSVSWRNHECSGSQCEPYG